MRARTNSPKTVPSRSLSRARAVAPWLAVATTVAFVACGPDGLNPRPDNPGDTTGAMMPMGGNMSPGPGTGGTSAAGGGTPVFGSSGGGTPQAGAGGSTVGAAGGGPATLPPDDSGRDGGRSVTDAGSHGDADPGDAVIVH
jgi:hypothetical protein